MKKDKTLNTLSPARRRFLKNLLHGALITGAAIVTANLRQKTAFAKNQQPTSVIVTSPTPNVIQAEQL